MQLFSPLDTDTAAALTASIERFGVLVPVVVDQHGQVLDGHHRRDIAGELGVDCPTTIVHVNTDDDRAEIARTLNMDRRQLSPDDRRLIVADLRRRGFSLRTIAKAAGVGEATVRRDLSNAPDDAMPDEIETSDGRRYPARRRRPEPGDTFTDDSGETRTVADVEEHGDELVIFDDTGDAAIVGTARFDNDSSPPRHPAKFSDAILAACAAHLPPHRYPFVLDPFAGTGRIHELPNLTVGIELEPEWAALHEDTHEGDALDLPFDDGAVNAICTSPTYGNRMADHHDARDTSTRHTYKHALGRDLHDNNSGAMQWGDDYRQFHTAAWAEAVRVLAAGGRFVLNIKDHVRGGELQPVTGWHVTTLVRLGLTLTHIEPVFTSGIRGQDNGHTRLDHEWVIALDKETTT